MHGPLSGWEENAKKSSCALRNIKIRTLLDARQNLTTQISMTGEAYLLSSDVETEVAGVEM
jgi:hypothetical protein